MRAATAAAPPAPAAGAEGAAAAAADSGGGGAALRDLRPEDKAKVARLIRQVVALGAENERLRAAAAGGSGDGGSAGAGLAATGGGEGALEGDARPPQERVRQLQETNRQVIAHNVA